MRRLFVLNLAACIFAAAFLCPDLHALQVGPPQGGGGGAQGGGGVEVPDPVEIQFPVDEFGISRVDWASIEIEDAPAYGFLTPNANFDGLLYVPEWTEIEFDSFSVTGMDKTGTVAFYLSVNYNGVNGTVQANHYFVTASMTDGEKTPHWHHELPRGVFTNPDGSPKIPGIDRDFIDKKEYGLILRPIDHVGTGGLHPDGYNPKWKEWLDNNPNATKADVLGHLDVLRIEHADVYTKGVRPKWDYKDWKSVLKTGREVIKRRLVKQLADAAADAAGRAGKRVGTTAIKKGPKAIPVVGTIVSVLWFTGDVLAGTPWDEALVDHGQDAIPIYGTVRGLYQIGGAIGELGGAAIDYTFSEPTDTDIDDQFWDDLKHNRIPIVVDPGE